MAGSNHSMHSQASTPITRQTTTTPSTRSTQASTAPPTTPSPFPLLRRRRSTFDLTPSPPLSETSTAWEHSPTASGPLADFARTSMYPPPLPPLSPQPSDHHDPTDADRTSQHWEHSTTATGPLADFARSGLYPPPPPPRCAQPRTLLPSLQPLPSPPRFPRRYNDVTDPSSRPVPASVPPRRPIDAAAQLRSAERRYPESARRPTAMDQAQAEVQRMLDEQLASGSASAELPPVEARGVAVAGLRVRRPQGHCRRNPRVQVAWVPDLGALGTVMPFPELEVRRREADGDERLVRAMAELRIRDEEEDEGVVGGLGWAAEESVLDLSEEDQMRLEDELAEMMVEGSSDGDADASTMFYGLDGAAQSGAVMAGRRSSVDSWGLRRSIVEELADARRARWESEDSMGSEYSTESGYILLPPPFPSPESLPMYVQALQKAGLEGLEDLPELVMQNFMRQARERDEERNQRIQVIQESREEIYEKILRRPGSRMRQSSDAEAVHLLVREINLLWHYDVHHWPTLEPLDYGLDDSPWECEVLSVPCWLDEPNDWNPDFRWDAPFSARRRCIGVLSLISDAQDRPMSPSSTDFGFVRATIKAIEETFQR